MRFNQILAMAAGTMLASAANAATFFTDAGAFAAATTGQVTSDFAGIAQPGFFVNQPSFTVGGVTFDNADFDFIIGASFVGSYNNSPFYSGQNNALTQISFAGTTAFGMSYGSYAHTASPISFTLSDGSQVSTSLPGVAGTAAFFGFTSATSITGVTVNNNAGAPFVFDVVDFSVAEAGSVGAVPEPSSCAMLIAGFGLVGAASRRRRRAIAA